MEKEDLVFENEKIEIIREPNQGGSNICYFCFRKKDNKRFNEEEIRDIEKNLQDYSKWEKVKELRKLEEELNP